MRARARKSLASQRRRRLKLFAGSSSTALTRSPSVPWDDCAHPVLGFGVADDRLDPFATVKQSRAAVGSLRVSHPHRELRINRMVTSTAIGSK